MKCMRLVFLGSVLALSACNTVDNYMLGKDNTPTPSALSKIEPKVQLTKEWSRKLGSKGDGGGYLKLAPVVKGQFIYTADYSGVLAATNRHDGKPQWKTDINAHVVSGPAINNDLLAVTTADAKLVVLDSKSGQVQWTKALSNEALASPTITKNAVLVKTIDGKLYAFDSHTTKKLWTYDHGSPTLILRSGSSPVVKGRLVVVGFADGKLDGINIDNGQLLWQRSVSYASGSSDVERLIDIDATPILAGNIVYVANYQGYVTALSLESGRFLWRHKLSTFKNMGIDSANLFASDSQDRVWAFNRNNGNTQWHQDELSARKISAPTYANHKVFINDGLGYLHLLASSDGGVLARALISQGAINSAPVVVDNDVYVFTNDGVLVKLKVA